MEIKERNKCNIKWIRRGEYFNDIRGIRNNK